MRRRRNPKVVFLVEQSQLAEQQYKVCEEYFGDQVKVITGEVQRKESFQEVSGWLRRQVFITKIANLGRSINVIVRFKNNLVFHMSQFRICME